MVRSPSRVVNTLREAACRVRRSRSNLGVVPARTLTRDGFTLIELLVVIAIIGILIAILLPSLRGARDSGRKAVCLSNEKQIATAMTNYGVSNKDIVPREGSVVLEATDELQKRYRLPWPVALRPFLDDRVSPNEDPNDLFAVAPYYLDPARPAGNHRIHYAVNAMPMIERGVADSAGARVRYWRRRGPQVFSRIPMASSTLYLTEFSDDQNQTMWNLMQAQPQEDIYWSQLYDVWDILHITSQSTQFRVGTSTHLGSGNALYLDGHANTVKKAVLENVDTWDDHDYGVRDEAPIWAQ